MELFLPSLFIFLLVGGIVVALVPRFSPLIITIIALIFLVLGTYHHFSMFWTEYKLSTWQDQIKLVAPGVFIAAIFIYILFAIGTFFTGGEVPVPAVPVPTEMPTATGVTNTIAGAFNTAVNTVKNTVANVTGANTNAGKAANNKGGILNTIGNAIGNASTNVVNKVNDVANTIRENMPNYGQKGNNANNERYTRSFFGTI